MSASVSAPDQVTSRPAAASRRWFAAAGLAAVVVCLSPPIAALSRRYVVAESIQFAVFAMVAPALLTLGAPWRLLRLSRPGRPGGPLDRLAASRGEQRSFLRAGMFLIVFMAVSLVWRLPPVMDALISQPALVLGEMVTLLAAGVGLWLELLASPPLTPRLPRPQRAAIAAMGVWFTWAVAYVIGFHNGVVYTAYGSVPGRAIGLVADQELAVAIIWTIAGLCFVPVVAVAMLGWLKDDTGEELQRIVRDIDQRAVVKGWGAPVKGSRGGARPAR